MGKSRTQYINFEIDLSEFDDDAIAEEARERGLSGYGEQSDSVTEMFYAFKLGKTDRAIEIARQIASDHTGKIL